MRSRLERQSEHNMFSIPFLSSAATLACIADSERDAMRLRSEIMELIARTRDTIAQSRALITEAEQCCKRLDYASTDLHCVQKSGTETLQ